MYSYTHRDLFRTKSNISDRAFFISVQPYFKNALNLIELPLSSKKTYNYENFGRKRLLLTMEHFFFSKFEITQWICIINIEKQSLDVFCRKSCSYKFHKIHRKTPVPESLF